MPHQPRPRPVQLEAGGKWLAFPCQGDCTQVCRIPIAPQRGAAGQSWRIASVDGAPLTASPSVDCKMCGFHGHIQEGEVVATSTPGSAEKLEAYLRQAFGEED